jgi:hypothetical protein
LIGKVIAQETKDDQTLSRKLLLQYLEARILRCEASQGGGIDRQHYLPAIMTH